MPGATSAETVLGRSDSGSRAAVKSAAINRHKQPVPASAAPAHSLWLRDVMLSNKADWMFPKPKSLLLPNSYAFESEPMVKPTGFREYDARWLFGKEINLMGVQALGMGLGTLIAELGVRQEVVTGHDFRGYSASIKYALISGLQAAGCRVHDIGLAMTPMAYFAQFELDVPCVAMVTASHNDNGWTGVKMGANRPLTFGPDEMTRLKQIVLNAEFDNKAGGSYRFHQDFPARYIADLTRRPKL
jgi:phosphomannomutase/phosphoglucomutase